jgi:hypothetical protein
VPETQATASSTIRNEVSSAQWVETVVAGSQGAWGHLFKFGFDFQHSGEGRVQAVHWKSVALTDHVERTAPGAATEQEVTAAELAVFAQDRWRIACA